METSATHVMDDRGTLAEAGEVALLAVRLAERLALDPMAMLSLLLLRLFQNQFPRFNYQK
jgi:hypothetical protein